MNEAQFKVGDRVTRTEEFGGPMVGAAGFRDVSRVSAVEICHPHPPAFEIETGHASRLMRAYRLSTPEEIERADSGRPTVPNHRFKAWQTRRAKYGPAGHSDEAYAEPYRRVEPRKALKT